MKPAFRSRSTIRGKISGRSIPMILILTKTPKFVMPSGKPSHAFGSAEFLGSIIYSGAFDRYPGFRFVLGESSIGRIPYFLQRMDYEYEEEESFHLRMRLKPSDYFRVNGFVTFERDAVGGTHGFVGRR